MMKKILPLEGNIFLVFYSFSSLEFTEAVYSSRNICIQPAIGMATIAPMIPNIYMPTVTAINTTNAGSFVLLL